MLYLLKTIDYYKVGYAKLSNLQNRIQTYTTYNPYVELLGVREGTTEDESTYHRMFSKYEGYGEWFKVPKSIIDSIRSEFENTDLVRITKPNKRNGDSKNKNYYKKKRGCIIQSSLSGERVNVFKSITEASQITRFKYEKIRACVNGEKDSYKGYIWTIDE